MTEDSATPDTKQARREAATPLLVALAVMVVWGGTPVFSKIAASQIDPLLVGVLRTVIAGALALPIVVIMRQPFPSGARRRRLLAFSGFAAFIAFPLIFTVAQHSTSVLHGTLIVATLPVFTSLFGALAERRKVSAAWVAGIVIAMLGEVLVIAWRTGGAAPGATLGGDLAVLVSSVICAAGYVAGARLTQSGYASLPTTLWGAGISAIVLVPLLGWLLIRDGVPHAGPAAWVSVLILAVLTSIVGYIAWYWALGKGGISRMASVQFTQPLFGLVLAMIVLGERPTALIAVAAVAILLGVWLVQRAAPSGQPAGE